MSRLQQDTFIDEEEEACPLCVEEFDVQDRNFKPCPCGYQICQFCFNNIRTNLNGLCPACRREYREETIEYKAITAEELKAEDSKKKRIASEKRKHEAQKREIEALNRKHLSGLRVIQRNLVYVTGLNPRIREDELLATLRGDQYFGQYGKILKIVVNKRTAQGGPTQIQNHHHDSQGLGVYVTFSNKNEAEKCIAAVDSSQNGDRTLRATYGTTKYCSAYLRNETCPNKNCMFLHEPGEEAESFSRMELSTANSRQNNQPKEQLHSHGHQPQPSRPPPREHHPPPSHHDSSQMARTNSHVDSLTSAENEGPSALPSTANWAKNPPTPATRPASLVHSATNHQPTPKVPTPSPKDIPSSPLVHVVQTVRSQDNGKKSNDRAKSTAPLATITPSNISSASSASGAPNINGKSVGVIGQPAPPVQAEEETTPPSTAVIVPTPKPKLMQTTIPLYILEQRERLMKAQRALTNPNFRFVLSPLAFSADEYDALCKIPPMFDKYGGKRRREMMEKMKKQQIGELGSDEATRGEGAQQPPIGTVGVHPMGVPMRGLTPLQQQQQQRENLMLKDAPGQQQQQQTIQGLSALQQESLQQQQSALRAQTPQGLVQQAASQQGFGAGFQNGQGPQQQGQHQSSHARQSSRYTFANETAGTAVNARSNAAHMAEQVRMMPPQQQQMPHQQLAQMYGGAPGLGGSLLGSVQQPPPGLKSAPTPPAPGLGGIPMGNMPGLGQFSGIGLGGGHHAKSDSENLLLRELLAGNGASRLGGASGAPLMRGGDGKRNVPPSVGGRQGYTDRRGVVDLGDPSILQARVAQPQHQMQHQQGIQVGGHGQQGGILDFGAQSAAFPAIFNSLLSPTANTLTPGVSDEDFPALAPVPAPKILSKPTPVGTKKKDKKVKLKTESSTPQRKEPALRLTANELEAEVSKFVEENLREKVTMKKEDVAEDMVEAKKGAGAAWGKQKSKLVGVDTTSTPANESRKGKEKENETPFNSKPDTTVQTSVELAALVASKKQGPLMMRILSKDSTASVGSSSVNTPSAAEKSTMSATESVLHYSDTASICTTESRPVTPPSSELSTKKKKDGPITGPALADMPVAFVKSKSALKKERIAAMKEKERKEAEDAAATKAKDVHAPIVGRMKKKKEKKTNRKPGERVDNDDTASERPEDTASITSRAYQDDIKDDDCKRSVLAEDLSEREEARPVNSTPAQIIADIQSEESLDFKDYEMFKPLVGLKWEHHISSEDIQKIRAGVPSPTAASSSPSTASKEPPRATPSIQLMPGSSPSSVHLSLRGGGSFETRMLVTPQGSVLRGLTPLQEKRYIEMEERRRNERSWERWGGSAPSNSDLSGTSYPVEKTADWKAAVTARTMAAGLAAAGSVARHMHLGPEEATRLSTKEALDYLWNTVMPALPGYAQEHLEGLAHSMALSGCKVSLGFDEGGQVKIGECGEPTVTVDVKLESGSSGSPAMGVKELEKLVYSGRKETEGLEKKMEKLIKRNRKIVGLV